MWEIKSSLGIAILGDVGFGNSREFYRDTQTLVIEYTVTYASGILGCCAMVIYYTLSLISKNSKKRDAHTAISSYVTFKLSPYLTGPGS